MSGDLVSGGYPVINPLAALGLGSNGAQSNINARTNLSYGILGNLQDAAAALVSGKVTLVPVPVCVGDEFATVTVLVGATAASSPTHSWAQLYSGTLTTAKALTTQSTDGGTAAIAASAAFAFTLGAKYIIQPGDAPYGYILAGVSVTATSAVPSLVSGTVPTATQYAWFADSPLLGATEGSALAGAAPASITLSSASALASPPVVFLT